MCSIVDVEMLIINALKKCIYNSISTHRLLYLLNSALDQSGWHRPEVFFFFQVQHLAVKECQILAIKETKLLGGPAIT